MRLIRSYAWNSEMFFRAEADIESSRGSPIERAEKDHDGFAISGAENSVIRLLEARDIESKSGTTEITRVANAQDILDCSCVAALKCLILASAAFDIACSRGMQSST